MTKAISLDDLVGVLVDGINYAAHRDKTEITLTMDEANAAADVLIGLQALLRKAAATAQDDDSDPPFGDAPSPTQHEG